MNDENWLRQALRLAAEAAASDEVPVGAVVVYEGRVIGQGHNQPIRCHDPSAHAEIVALRQAAQTLQNYRLPGATLYCTLEPCVMCCGAIIQARLARVVFCTLDPKAGAVQSVLQLLNQPSLNHRVSVEYGVFAQEAGQLLKQFFQARRSHDKTKHVGGLLSDAGPERASTTKSDEPIAGFIE